MFFFDKGSLILREDFRIEFIHSEAAGDSLGSPAAVSCHHDHSREACAVEGFHNALRLFPDRILDTDHCRQFVVQSKIKQRAVVGKGIIFFLCALGERTFFILKNKMPASDQRPDSIDGTGDPVCHDIFHLRVPLLVDQASLRSLPDDRIGDRVGEMFLQAGRKAQKLILIMIPKGNDLAHTRCGVGQGSGFVKDDRIGLSDCLQELAALDVDMMVAALPHGREDTDRHCQLQRAGEIHHQEGKRPRDIAGEQPGQGCASQGPGHKGIRQVRSAALCRGLQFLGVLDHINDLVIAAAAQRLVDPDFQLALLEDRARINIRAFRLADGKRFSSH